MEVAAAVAQSQSPLLHHLQLMQAGSGPVKRAAHKLQLQTSVQPRVLLVGAPEPAHRPLQLPHLRVHPKSRAALRVVKQAASEGVRAVVSQSGEQTVIVMHATATVTVTATVVVGRRLSMTVGKVALLLLVVALVVRVARRTLNAVA